MTGGQLHASELRLEDRVRAGPEGPDTSRQSRKECRISVVQTGMEFILEASESPDDDCDTCADVAS